MKIVIVIPCYNEEESITNLLKEVSETVAVIKAKQKIDADILLVNDGSSDNTLKVIKELCKKYSNLYYLSFAANRGHQSALRAGLNASTGYDAAVMLDADLQHPPKLIPSMIEEWQAGAKIVQMVRSDSLKDVSPFKFYASNLFYKAIKFLSGLDIVYGSSDFRLIDKIVTAEVEKSPEKELFLRGYFFWLPVSRKCLTYAPNKRFAGSSSYTFKKNIKMTYNSVMQFSEKPLRLSVYMGLTIAFLAMVYGITLIGLHFNGISTASGWTSLMTLILFMFGLNFSLFGIVGLYVSHSLVLAKRRPEYIIQETNFETNTHSAS